MAEFLPPRADVAHDDDLLQRRISELGLSIEGSPVEQLVLRLYSELDAKGLRFHPPVYLSDEWGCPEATPLIGVPFYLADPALARFEAEAAAGIEDDDESMRYMRHEAGHAFNYAYRLYDREDWRRIFGPYSRPYHDRYHVDPFSRDYVRHVLGWYAQKHPDEDFAETFAVWLTPGLDWRAEYAGWPALRKLEYVDAVMHEVVAGAMPVAPVPTADDLPVSAIGQTVAEHYRAMTARVPIDDDRLFDGDLRTIFGSEGDGPPAGEFIRRHLRELIGRIGYWTGEGPQMVRAFLEHLAKRADALDLCVIGFEASTLIELTAFGTAVMMNYRYTDQLGHRREAS